MSKWKFIIFLPIIFSFATSSMDIGIKTYRVFSILYTYILGWITSHKNEKVNRVTARKRVLKNSSLNPRRSLIRKCFHKTWLQKTERQQIIDSALKVFNIVFAYRQKNIFSIFCGAFWCFSHKNCYELSIYYPIWDFLGSWSTLMYMICHILIHRGRWAYYAHLSGNLLWRSY